MSMGSCRCSAALPWTSRHRSTCATPPLRPWNAPDPPSTPSRYWGRSPMTKRSVAPRAARCLPGEWLRRHPMTTMMTDQNRHSEWQSRPVATDPNFVDSVPSEDWSMLVHDLRNPLATVNGYAELLRRRAARGQVQPTEIAQSLRHIQDAVATIERLLDQFSV